MTAWTITPAPIDDIDVTLVMRDYMVEIASRYYGRPVTDDELRASLAVAPLRPASNPQPACSCWPGATARSQAAWMSVSSGLA